MAAAAASLEGAGRVRTPLAERGIGEQLFRS